MVDFKESLQKIFPTGAEMKVVGSWLVASAVLFLLMYVARGLTSGTANASSREPVFRLLVLIVVAYVVLMLRDIITYYVGITGEEMFQSSPVMVFGIMIFFTIFILVVFEDIYTLSEPVAKSAAETRGNLYQLFFDDSSSASKAAAVVGAAQGQGQGGQGLPPGAGMPGMSTRDGNPANKLTLRDATGIGMTMGGNGGNEGFSSGGSGYGGQSSFPSLSAPVSSHTPPQVQGGMGLGGGGGGGGGFGMMDGLEPYGGATAGGMSFAAF
jgi:hypothetical protein